MNSSFLEAMVFQELFQHGSFPGGIVPQEETAPAWVPHGTQFLPENMFLHEFLSTGQESAPVQALEVLLRTLHLLSSGFRATGGQPAFSWSSPWVMGKYLFHSPEHLLSLLLH